jgi:4-methylaminobutanoate oxidase (formaldehyde-forming)
VPASYVGGLGWEIFVAVEEAAALYERLWHAGAGLGMKDCGYYALDALRIEAGRRAFGAELSPDCTPYEAGLAYSVRAELRQPPGRLAKRLLMFTFPATELFAWGGEPILRNGAPVGELSSVGYSATLSCMVGMGFVHSGDIEGSYAIEVSGRNVPAKASLKAPWPG